MRRSAAFHGLGAGGDGFHDIVVAGAPADIAFKLFPDGALVEFVAEAMHHVDRRHDHAWRAEAALQTLVLAERLLHGMELIGGGETPHSNNTSRPDRDTPG